MPCCLTDTKQPQGSRKVGKAMYKKCRKSKIAFLQGPKQS